MLESLRTRPATKEDVGKTVYTIEGHPFKFLIEGGIPYVESTEGDKFELEYDIESKWFYWQEPVLVSKSEYEELKANQIKGRCKDCKKTDVMEETNTLICLYHNCQKYSCDYCSEFEPKETDKCNGCKKTELCSKTTKDRRNYHHKCELFEPKGQSTNETEGGEMSWLETGERDILKGIFSYWISLLHSRYIQSKHKTISHDELVSLFLSLDDEQYKLLDYNAHQF